MARIYLHYAILHIQYTFEVPTSHSYSVIVNTVKLIPTCFPRCIASHCFHTSIVRFSSWKNVNDWIHWFTHSHPSNGKNRTRNGNFNFRQVRITIYYIVDSEIPKNTQWDIFHIFTTVVKVSIAWLFPANKFVSKWRRSSKRRTNLVFVQWKNMLLSKKWKYYKRTLKW